MNRVSLVFLLAVFLIRGGAARAEELVRFPEGNAAWTVEITHLNAAGEALPPEEEGAAAAPRNAPAPRKARKIEVIQMNGIRRERIFWTHGKTSERWKVPSLPVVFVEDPGAGNVAPVELAGMGEKLSHLDLPADLSAFSWMRPEFLQEKPVHYRGRNCLHFEGFIPLPKILENSPEPPPIKAEAWVDPQTLLPVARKTDTSLCVFTFATEPPVGPLEIPAKFKAKIDYYKLVMGVR